MIDNPIKWSGSKRPLAKEIISYLPKEIETYYEPFCGSCSVMFELLESDIKINNIVCSDVNKELMDLWVDIKNNPKYIIDNYKEYWNKFNSKHRNNISIEEWRKTIFQIEKINFNTLKDKVNVSCFFICLLRTSFNGLVRYNKKGEYNTGCHFTRPGIHPDTLEFILEETSKLLNKHNVTFINQLYNDINPKTNDFVFLDPPYSNSKGMYYGNINEMEFVNWVNNLSCDYCLTFNGKRNSSTNNNDLELNNTTKIMLNKKSSSFSRLKNRDVKVGEFMYIKTTNK